MGEQLYDAYDPQWDQELNGTPVSAEQHLNNMREWLRSKESVVSTYSIINRYDSTLSDLTQIHEDYKSDPTSALPDNIPRKLLANFVKYLKNLDDSGVDHEIILSHDFLSDLYKSYAEDVGFFAVNIDKRAATSLALHHKPSALFEIQNIYEGHPVITNRDIKMAFTKHTLNPWEYLQNLECKVNNFRGEIEPRLREEYGQPGQWSPNILKKICLYADPEAVARKTLVLNNEISNRYPNADHLTIENLVKKAVIVSGGEWAKLLQQILEVTPSLNPSPEDLIKAKIEFNHLRQIRIQKPVFGPLATSHIQVQKLLNTINSNWRDSFEGLDIINNVRFLRTTVTFHNNRLSAKDADLAIDTSQSNLYSLFCVFADDVAQLKQEAQPQAAEKIARYHEPGVYTMYKEKYKNELSLPTPASIESIIVSHPNRIDINIKKFIGRYNDLKKTYGSSISGPAARRIARLTNSMERAEEYFDDIKTLKRLFEINGEEIDDLSLQNLALYGKDPEVQYNRFLELRRYLKEAFIDDDHVEQWMINSVASLTASEAYSTYKLTTLRAFNIKTGFNITSDQTTDMGRSRHEIIKDKNASSPEDIIIQKESDTEQQALVENLLSKLNDNDRLAVEAIFGLSNDFSKQELEEMLNVNDLNDYVMNDLIPRLKN